MTATTLPDALLKKLRSGSRFLITSHANPDGDAVGSSLGMARILRRMGKTATVWLRDEPPHIFRQLPGADRIHHGEEPPAGFPEGFSAVIVLECPSLDRTGLEGAFGKTPLLNVDHHLGNQLYGAVNWVDPAAPAVGEMVQRIARALKAPLGEDTANLLLTALVSDTGGFRYGNTTEEAFLAAAELAREGARPDQVARWIYESDRPQRMELLRLMLGSLELHQEGRIATAYLSQAMFDEAGAEAGDAEGLINTPRSIAGVEAVALFKELPDNGLKVSLRSRGTVDVEAVASRHDGGGHKNAAGCRFEGTALDDAKATIVGELAEALA